MTTKRWRALTPPTPGPAFDPEVHLDGLPDSARRYFAHAIEPGVPLSDGTELRMRGRIKAAGRWLPFTAIERIAPNRGFEWRVRAGRGPVRFRGSDWFEAGRGGLRMRMFGVVPVVNAGGPDIARSAAGRLAVEAIWAPASMLPWAGAEIAVTDAGFAVTFSIAGEEETVRLSVAQDGSVTEVSMARWGDVGADGKWRRIPFGGDVLAERTFGGYTIPSELRVGWWRGTACADEHEFFQAQIESARFS